jgi:hypothetical protein
MKSKHSLLAAGIVLFGSMAGSGQSVVQFATNMHLVLVLRGYHAFPDNYVKPEWQLLPLAEARGFLCG